MNETHTLLDKLETSHLVDAAVVAKLRSQVKKSARPVSPRAILKLLVDKNLVTTVQAKRLLAEFETTQKSAAPATPPPPPKPDESEDELGLAPLEEDEPPLRKSSGRTSAPAANVAPGFVDLDDDDAELISAGDLVDDDLMPLDDESPASVGSSADESAVTLDEGDLVEEELGADNLLGDLPEFTTTAGADGDLLGAPAAKRGRGWQSKRVRKSVWDSPLLLIGGGTLLLLVILFFALVWATSRGSGDDALAQAHADFESGSYTQAINKYDEYLKRYPTHHGASTARVNRGVAVLRKAVEGTSDWPQALDVAKQVLSNIEGEPDFSTVRPDLANLLPEIAAGLAQQAQRAPQQKLVDQSEEALALVHGNIPTALKNAVQLNNIEESLAFTRHTLARETRTRESLGKIAAAVRPIDGDTPAAEARAAFQTAYDVRRSLLRDYPELEAVSAAEDADTAARRTRQLAEQLAESVLSVSQAESQVVQFAPQSTPPLTQEPQSPLRAAVTLARRSGGQLQADGQVVFCLAAGAAYGLDAATGKVLWRRFVGMHTDFTPISVAGAGAGDALLADSVRHEIVRVDAATGELRWRSPLGEPFDAAPLIASDTILVATRSGRLVRIDMKTGESPGHTVFPQDLRVAPAAAERHKLLYQVGDHSNLYVLSADDGQCREVAYLAHLPGTVRVPPVPLGRYVIVVENDKLHDATIRVLLTDENGLALQQVHTEAIVGHVDVSPVVAGNGRLLLIATDRGALYAYEIGTPGQGRHLVQVAQRAATDDEPAPAYPLVRGTQFWVAGRGLTSYDIQAARGRLTPRRVIAGHSTHLQTPVPVGDAVIHVRSERKIPGVIVAAHNVAGNDGANPIWETFLAAPLTVPPSVGSDGAISAVTTTGGYFVVEGDALDGAAIVDEPVAEINVLRPPQPLPSGGDSVQLGDGLMVVAAATGEKRVLLLEPGAAEGALRWLPLAQPIGASPVGFAGGLLAPTLDGMILLVDPSDGRSLTEPFQPRLTGGTSLAWTRPEPVGEELVAVADGQAKIYLLGVAAEPKPHLAAVKDVTVNDAIVAPLAALNDVLYAADAAGKLLAFKLPELEPGTDWPLGAPPAWGPKRVGGVVLVATTSDELLCLDERQQLLWRMPLRHGELAGDPLADGDSFILTHTSGAVTRISAETGEEQAAVESSQAWATGAVRMDDGLLLAGHDGSLHVIDVP